MADLVENVPEIHVNKNKKTDSFSSDHEVGTDSDKDEEGKKLRLLPRVKRQDSGSSVGDEETIELTPELKERIISQAEYYFSDENLKRDGFLLKHVKRNKEGFVNLKLLASFKKMKAITRDYKIIGDALKDSDKLVVNDTGLKLRRVYPLPKELLEQVRVKHVVVSNFSEDNPSMNYVTDAFFNHKDDVVSVRIIKPGKKFPNDLQSHFSRHAELRNEVVAVVEFENADVASAAIKTSVSNLYKDLKVGLLELGPKQGKKKENGDTASDSDVSVGKKKTNRNNRFLDISGREDYSSCPSSSDSEFSSFSSYGKRYGRSHGNSPSNSPKSNRKLDANNNSRNSSPLSSPALSPKFHRKIKTPDRTGGQNSHKLSPLIHNENTSSSQKPSLEQHSPWMMKRMQLNSNICQTATCNTAISGPCHKQLEIVRQPRGPDGSIGFMSHPVTKYVLVHSN